MIVLHFNRELAQDRAGGAIVTNHLQRRAGSSDDPHLQELHWKDNRNEREYQIDTE